MTRSWILALIVSALVCVRPAAAETPKPSGIHYVYLIRHGAYDRDTLDDTVGGHLNALGHQQARLVAERLKALPVTFTSLTSSDLTRARETGDDIGEVLVMSVARDTLLRECTPNANRQDYMRNHTAEDIAACDANLTAAFRKYMTPTPAADRQDILVCHGNMIRWLVSKALGMDTARWPGMEIGNGSMTIIAVRPDSTTRLIMFSDVGHLPVDSQSWTGKGAGWGKTTTK